MISKTQYFCTECEKTPLAGSNYCRYFANPQIIRSITSMDSIYSIRLPAQENMPVQRVAAMMSIPPTAETSENTVAIVAVLIKRRPPVMAST